MANAIRGRRVVPRPAVPNVRAVVGGLLVVAAGLGTWSARSGGDAPPSRSWLVVDRAVAPGQVIASDDLAVAAMDLHPDTAERAVAETDAASVLGRVALAPLAPGDLVLRTAVARPGAASGTLHRVGVALDPADALNGEVAVGETVDVVATDDEAGTRVVVEGAVVASRADADDVAVGRGDSVRLTLLVPDRASALALLDARRTGTITLVAGAGDDAERADGPGAPS